MKEKQLRAKIKKLKEQFPELPSLDYFYMAVDESGLGEGSQARYFNVFVDKKDYEMKDKKEILNYISDISKKYGN